VPSAASVTIPTGAGKPPRVQRHRFAAALQDEPLSTESGRPAIEQLDPLTRQARTIPTVQRLVPGELVAAVGHALFRRQRLLGKVTDEVKTASATAPDDRRSESTRDCFSMASFQLPASTRSTCLAI